MRDSRWSWFVLLACAWPAQLAAQEPPTPVEPPPASKRGLKLGVVDACVLFRDDVRRPAFEAAFEAELDAVRKELEADTRELVRLEPLDFVGLVPEGEGDERRRKLEEHRTRATAFEQKSERLQKQLVARREQLLGRLLDEIDGVVRDYGKRHSYDVILHADELAELEGHDGELTAALRDRLRSGPRQQVAFHSDAVDITYVVQRELHSEAVLHRRAARDLELGLPGRGASPKVPLWPHLAALTPPAGWQVETRPGAPDRTRWRAEVTVRGLGDATGPTGVVKVLRVADDAGAELELVLPPLPASGPFTWTVRPGARLRVDLFRRRDGERQGTAVALREPTGRLLLFYDDGLLPPCGVEDMDDLTATLTPLPAAPQADDAWVATTLRLDRGNDSVTLRDDDPPALLGRSGLVARVVRARLRADDHRSASSASDRVGAWLVWRPAE